MPTFFTKVIYEDYEKFLIRTFVKALIYYISFDQLPLAPATSTPETISIWQFDIIQNET